MRKSLNETEQRLREIDLRRLDPESTTLANGLPETPEAAKRMGAFVGNADAWVTFRREFDSAAGEKAKQRIDGKESLFRELTSGNADVLLVVAEATGRAIYFNGEKITLKELEELPTRSGASMRPRQVVLFSCFAGRYAGESTSVWERLRIVRSYTPLAKILLEKRFADRVIAPTGAIRANQALQTLKQILDAPDNRIKTPPKGWMEWVRTLPQVFVSDEQSINVLYGPRFPG